MPLLVAIAGIGSKDFRYSADPCRDAARFIVCLGRLALTKLGSIRKLDSTSETFRKASLAGDGRRMADQAFYKAALHLQEAKRDVVSQAPRRLESRRRRGERS